MSIFDRFFGKRKPPRIGGLKGAGIARTPGGDYKHAHLTEEESAGFLDEGDLLTPSDVRSSCIYEVQFFKADNKLMVTFHKDGKPTHSYLYSGITRGMMVEFLRAGSKGSWISTQIVHAGYPFTRLS